MLNISDLSKDLGETPVLNGLDLQVADRSVFGLVGVNGAGKSTLLRLIAGVYEPDGGQILLDGSDPFRDPSVREKIAFVSDEPYFPVGCTVSSLKTFYSELYEGFDEAAFEKYRRMFELEEDASAAGLSKGMKRRLSLLMALSVHPKLLLLDEAYDGLEPLARLHFKQTLTDLLEDEEVSVILSSHNLKELEDICDSFGILDGGKILSGGDLLEERAQVNKYQAAFAQVPPREAFGELDVLQFEQEGKVCRLVIRGDPETVLLQLQALDPLILDRLPVNFEELFIYEVEKRKEEKA